MHFENELDALNYLVDLADAFVKMWKDGKGFDDPKIAEPEPDEAEPKPEP